MPPLTAAHPIDEASLIQAAMNGDADAFAELFRAHYPTMLAYAYRLCLQDSDAEDIVQETFIKAARALPDYRPTAPFRHWLYRICTNSARDWLRGQARRRRLDRAMEAGERIDEGTRTPDHELAREALESLSEPLRSAVALVYFEGLNHAEAASVLGCAETIVSWRIFRGKKQLKTYLHRHE
jgi:RNA polymerase sigma-70 factor, ECF subfamily